MTRTNKKQLGDLSEQIAAAYLTEQGLEVITKNYRCPKGEIDLILKHDSCLIFVEVRSKTTSLKGLAEESLNYHKIQKLKAAASFYLLQAGYKEWPPIRFDVVAIKWENENPLLNWIPNAF